MRTETEFPIDWAAIQNNLGLAYRDRITGDKAQNIESAIAAYKKALLVRTETEFPIDWAAIQNNLGLAYRDRITGDKAQNIESAIAAYEKALQIYTQLVSITKQYWHTYIIDRLDKALEIAERSQARNLVELLTNRDLLPKVDVDPEITEQFQQLKQEIRVKEGELQKNC